MEWLARSADPRKNQPAQTYARHVLGVRAHVRRFVQALSGRIDPDLLDGLRKIVFLSADKHDLGKLDSDNQAVLRGDRKAKTLPIVHTDAGAVDLMGEDALEAALLVASHHVGLPDFVKLANTDEADLLRAEDPARRMKEPLDVLLDRHATALAEPRNARTGGPFNIPARNLAVFYRMALSILVDADHSDSARPNRPLDAIAAETLVPLLPERRLAALDAYVAGFNSGTERNVLRRAVYEECKASVPGDRIVACDSPVGSGKTTAVMAHLLAVAKARNLRRVFVVLPFTNIIRQSAEVYRKALVLPGEKADDVVAEVHHLADFDDEASREYATQWNAPIVVTTAVAFFETLAAARPSALRRLHELAASAVFVDEAHAAVPAKFLPVVWRWMQAFANDWNVHWVLASGSLVRFWEMPEVTEAADEAAAIGNVPMLASDPLRDRSAEFESARVSFETLPDAVSVAALLAEVLKAAGPRLVILNTVQNAAVVASRFVKSGKFEAVFHLSTALTPADREATLERVHRKLEHDANGNWVLVGTSCVEAGVDLDFATGFREMASLTSLLQTSGRVNRSGKRQNARVVSFRFTGGDGLNANPALEDSSRVLRRMLEEGSPLSASLCTEALRRELQLDPRSDSLLKRIVAEERRMQFPEVERDFKVIAADTRIVVVEQDVMRRMESFEPVDWREILRGSVQLWGYKIEKMRIPEVVGHPGAFKWNLEYSPFLGIMEGVLKLSTFFDEGGGVL